MKFKKSTKSKIVFKLDKLMDKKGYSKNKVCVEAGIRFETLQGYYNGTVSRVDLYILTRLCEVLECNVQDIIEYKY